MRTCNSRELRPHKNCGCGRSFCVFDFDVFLCVSTNLEGTSMHMIILTAHEGNTINKWEWHFHIIGEWKKWKWKFHMIGKWYETGKKRKTKWKKMKNNSLVRTQSVAVRFSWGYPQIMLTWGSTSLLWVMAIWWWWPSGAETVRCTPNCQTPKNFSHLKWVSWCWNNATFWFTW